MDLTRTAAVITAIVTIFVALAGYLITYWNNILLSRRTDRLNRINKQLNEFYGPLYSLVYSSSKSWVTFRTKYRSQKRSYFSDNPLKKWENNDFSEHTSLIDYPGRELLDYSHRSFQRTERKTIEFSWRKNKGHLKLHF